MWLRLKSLPHDVPRAALSSLRHGITNYAAASHLIVALLEQLAPPDATTSIKGPIRDLVAARSGAGTVVSLSIVVALFGASAYVGIFIWAVAVVVGGPPARLLADAAGLGGATATVYCLKLRSPGRLRRRGACGR